MRLDVSFMGRGADPVRVKSAARIHHDAGWSTLKDDLVFVGTCVLIAFVAWLTAALWMAV